MPTPSIQTLRADAQQVLNLDSISAVRSVVAATLANANAGTPLNPNLTTQQLWNEFYQIVTQPKSDIESIIANQLMKFLFAPPAPGGAGADKQVIFNDGGVLAGDPQFLWNKTTNLLTVTGSATITGDLTVDTNTLKVDSANNRVGVNTASPLTNLHVGSGAGLTGLGVGLSRGATANFFEAFDGTKTFIGGTDSANAGVKVGSLSNHSLLLVCNNTTQLQIDPLGVFSFTDGAGGTRMTLNATGLGVGGSPSSKLSILAGADGDVGLFRGGSTRQVQLGTSATAGYLNTDNGSAGLEIRTQGVARAYVDNSGNVGIGVTPSYKLDVSTGGALNTTARLVGNDQANVRLRFENAGGGGRIWELVGGLAGSNNRWFSLRDVTGSTTPWGVDDSMNVISNVTGTAPTLSTNSQMVFNLTSNTNLRISVRGTDGVTRTANLTLA